MKSRKTNVIKAKSGIPVFTSPAHLEAAVGQPVKFQLKATGKPTKFDAVTLPAGLAIDYATGLITGIPQVAGQSAVIVHADNKKGTNTGALAISVR